jgi:hypothetical protein
MLSSGISFYSHCHPVSVSLEWRFQGSLRFKDASGSNNLALLRSAITIGGNVQGWAANKYIEATA